MAKTIQSVKRFTGALAAMMFMAGMIAPEVAGAANEIHINNEFSVTSNDIDGDGKDQSSLTEGLRFLEILALNGNMSANGVNFDYSFGVKGTDDRRNDVKEWSLTNAQGRISNPNHALTFGDTFESFTQYSLSTAVKGGSYKYANPASILPEVTFLTGVAYPRWDSFCRKDMIERSVTGVRVKKDLTPEFQLGFNGVNTTDAQRRDGESLLKGNTYGGDLEYRPIPGLTLRGEASFSSYEEDYVDAETADTDGYAVKITAIGDGDPSRVTLEFEHVAAEYMTLVGSATPDREKAKAKWRYKFARDTIINLGFLWYRDNVDSDSTKEYTTNHYKPDAGVTLKRLFDRKYLVTTLTYKVDAAQNRETDTFDQFATMNYRDRFFIVDADLNLGANFYDAEKTRKGAEYIYNLSLSSRQTLGPVIIKPQIYLGGWSQTDELADDKTDIMYEYSFGIGIDLPDLGITSNFKIGQNKLDKDEGTDTEKLYGNASIFYKPGFLKNINTLLFVRLTVNDYGYSAESPGAMDFRETSYVAGVNMQF